MKYRLVVRRHGVSGGRPGVGGSPGEKSFSNGWTKAASSNNAKWLQSVRPPLGFGIALTLTLSSLPSADEWRSLVRDFNKFLSSNDLCYAYHFVVEWTRRGLPHIHYMVYLDIEESAFPTWSVWLRRKWCNISACAEMHAQCAKAVESLHGWLEYVAKHAARGIHHYQRATPPLWCGVPTGRMWGYGGIWPERQEAKLSLSESDFVCFSRLLRKYMKKKGRRNQKRNLFFTPKKIYPSGVSEWVPSSVTTRLLEFVVSRSSSDVCLLSQ